MPDMGRLESPDTAPRVVEGGIRFSLLDTKAKKVTIAGDFNDWSATTDPLFDREGNGLWTIVLPLAPGSYQYKFVVDGDKWMPDPANAKRVKDGFDGYNSVIEVAAGPSSRAPQ
jgi:1,4-alpha-glucan branching enzyme